MPPFRRRPRVARGERLNGLWVATLIALGMIFCCRAADPGGEYLIDVWTGENGLPNSSVTALAQTPDGYLWVGTYNRLARFDGVRFVTFDPSNRPELMHSRIRRLFLDASGLLWINTYDGSLTTYRHGHFSLEWVGDGSADATVSLVGCRSNRPVFLLHTGELIRRRPGGKGTNGWEVLRPPGATSGEMVAEDQTGALWCRGRDQKLWRLFGDRFEAVPTNPGLAGQTLYALTADAQGRIWVGTERELAVWEQGQFRNMTPTNGEATLSVSFLQPSQDGGMWVLGNSRVRKARGREWLVEAEACRDIFPGAVDRLGMLEDRRGGAWLYHYGKGLFHIRADGRARPLTTEGRFPGERIDCFLQDREGNFWAGVDRGGLVRLRERRFVTYGANAGLTAKAAVSVAEDRQGALWIGTFGAGLHRWQDGSWQTFALPGGTRGFVFSICPDTANRLWLSAGEEDLFLRVQDQFEPVSPPVHGVKALLAGRDGRVWAGTKTGLVCRVAGEFLPLPPETGMKRIDVRALAEDECGVVWAGMGDGTLYRIETNHVDSFQAKDAWATQPIWSLCADAEGSVWVGTFRGGLLRFRNGEFVRYMTRHGLPDDVLCQILDDGAGRLWIGSQQGIFCVPKSDLHAFARGETRSINCTGYGRYDGLPSLECSGNYQPAAWRGRDGRLFFATLKGVVSVQPDDLASNRQPPPVVLEEVVVDGQLQSSGGSGSRSDFDSATVSLQVPPGKRQVLFRYTGLSFVSPDQVRFRYKLEPMETDWVEAGSRRWAQYSYLRPGSYSFRVIACNNDGVWSEQGAALSVRVLPHFYETAWFFVLAVTLMIAAVAALVRSVATRKYRRELARLEQQHAVERDRARIAKDIHDDLGAGLTQITLLSELARREPPDQAAVHLDRISGAARELTRAMDEIVWAVDPQHDTLAGLLDYASVYAEDFLRVAGIRCRLDLPTDLPEVRVEAEARYHLFLALKEALNNIVKHAHATEVRLGLRLEPAAFTLVVADDGLGLAGGAVAEGADRLNSGHGLGNLEQRLTAIGGRCVVHSLPGQGTRVELTVFHSPPASPIVATGQNANGGSESRVR